MRAEIRDWLWRHQDAAFGTMCSCTDSPAIMFNQFTIAIARVFGLNITFLAEYHCEIDAERRRFIMNTYSIISL
jgi:hypothetical protein